MSLPEITLDELARLVRLLGMLGSGSDGEALNAARFAAKWVREHQTDWETLLTPAPEPAVWSVAAVADPDAIESAADSAFQQGYDEGYRKGIAEAAHSFQAQARAQAAMASTWVPTNRPPGAPHSPLGSPYGPGGGFARAGQGPAPNAPGGPVRAPGTVPAGGWPPGSWQAVAQELLDQHAAVPGVLRSREEIFVSDILRRGFASLTPAQEHWLRDIAGRNHMSW